MAVGEQRHEHALEHLLLADDHPLDLEQGRLEGVADLFGAADGMEPPLLAVHVFSFWFRPVGRPAAGMVRGARTPCAALEDL